jgi:cytochrome c-type biogenesis protein CcmH/NrfG
VLIATLSNQELLMSNTNVLCHKRSQSLGRSFVWAGTLGVVLWVGACHFKPPKAAVGAQDVSALVQEGHDAFSQQNPKAAEQKAREAIKRNPTSIEARLLLVKILGPENPETPEHLKELIKLTPEREEAYLLLADTYLRQGKFEEAQKVANAGIKKSENASLFLMLGMASLELGDVSEARGAFSVAVDLAPRSIKPKLLLAASCLAMEDQEGAVDAFMDALKLDSNNPVARMGIAELFIAQQGAQEALELLEGIRWSEDPPARYFSLLGNAYSALSRTEEAVASLDMAVKKEPQQPTYTIKLGQALFDAGQEQEAVQLLGVAYQTWPKELNVLLNYAFMLVSLKDTRANEVISALEKLSPIGDLATLSLEAESAINEKDYPKAIRALEEAAQQNPTKVDPLLRLGAVQEMASQNEEAAKVYQRAQTLDPKDPRPGMAIAALLSESNPSKALSALDDVIARNPNLIEALLARAQLLIEVDRFSDAIRTFEEALSLRPDSSTVHNNFAWALVYEAKPAERDCKRGLRLAERAVELSDGKNAPELDTLAEAHRCNGNYDQAILFLDQALALNPSSDFYLKRRAEMEEERLKTKKRTKTKKSA